METNNKGVRENGGSLTQRTRPARFCVIDPNDGTVTFGSSPAEAAKRAFEDSDDGGKRSARRIAGL